MIGNEQDMAPGFMMDQLLSDFKRMVEYLSEKLLSAKQANHLVKKIF